MSGSTGGGPAGSSGTRRWPLAAAAAFVILAIAVWAATPPVVPMPSAPVWARCFEPIAVAAVPADAAEIALVRHKTLEPPFLVARVNEAADVLLEGWQPPRATDGALAGQRTTLRAGQRITLPAGATWTLSLERGFIELRRTDGSRFLVEPRARFGLHPAETYTAQLAAPIEAGTIDADGRVQLPQGARVEIVVPEGDPIGNPIVVRQTDRLLVGPLVLPSATSAFVPDVRPDREAAPYLAARVAAPGLDLDPTKRTLRACLWLGEERPRPTPISQIGTSGLGAAELVLGLPSDPFPWLDWRRGRMASLAVVDTDGRHVGTGQFVYPSRFWAFALATGITSALFLGLVWIRSAGTTWDKRWLMGLFLGDDGQPSLSLFQILLWTIVTVWALVFVFFSTGNLLSMNQQVMVLLGFAGAGSLAARWVALSRSTPAPRATDGGGARFWALLENDRGFDLFKLQLFVFTLLIAAYVAFRVVRQSAFPTIDTEFLLLMGVSNGLYVGSKVGQASDSFTLAQQRKLEWDALRLRVDDLEKAAADLDVRSSDLAGRLNSAADAAAKQSLADKKILVEKELTDARAELARARTDRDAKETAYKEAVTALAKV